MLEGKIHSPPAMVQAGEKQNKEQAREVFSSSKTGQESMRNLFHVMMAQTPVLAKLLSPTKIEQDKKWQ